MEQIALRKARDLHSATSFIASYIIFHFNARYTSCWVSNTEVGAGGGAKKLYESTVSDLLLRLLSSSHFSIDSTLSE